MEIQLVGAWPALFLLLWECQCIPFKWDGNSGSATSYHLMSNSFNHCFPPDTLQIVIFFVCVNSQQALKTWPSILEFLVSAYNEVNTTA